MSFRSLTTLAVFVFAIDAWQSSPWQQSVNLNGTLLCGPAAVPNKTIILTHIAALEKDDGKKPHQRGDPTGYYDATTTGDDGEFSFSVTLYSMLPINPALQVRHTCGTQENCTAVAKFIIFSECVRRGHVAVTQDCQNITADLSDAPNLDHSNPRCSQKAGNETRP